jgi:Zn-dependent protease with chaperone function
MKKRHIIKMLIVVGAILILAGSIFMAQSKSFIGPQSSFMYSNPQWTINGFFIFILGLVIAAFGIALWIYHRFDVLK